MCQVSEKGSLSELICESNIMSDIQERAAKISSTLCCILHELVYTKEMAVCDYMCIPLSGKLLTVAPWAAQRMPGLFALNERVILSGVWPYGLFTFTAVGAYNVGSIEMSLEQVKVWQQSVVWGLTL